MTKKGAICYFAAVTALIGGCFLAQTSALAKSTNIECCKYPSDVKISDGVIEPTLESIQKKDLLLLCMGTSEDEVSEKVEYITIETTSIEDIFYSDDYSSIIITLKENSDMSYNGSYDYTNNRYVFKECYTSKKTKKLSK